jgi:ribosomal protein S18 acetylase RimI-like enzyme
MTTLNHTIAAITSPDEAATRLKELANEWGIETFWSLDSCISTLRTQNSIISAASIEVQNNNAPQTLSSPYQGWYLATCQGADCELLFIYTAKIHRGLGLGRALILDLIARARQTSGIESIFLEVRESNQNAIKLYQHHGFMLISKRQKYYSNGEDALVYRLNLQK